MPNPILTVYGKLYKHLPVQVRRGLRAIYHGAKIQDLECRETVDAVEASYRRLGVVKEGCLVFDIGANIGIYADAFDRLGARVVAVEPVPECARIMREKFAKRQRVVVVEKGVGDAEGELEMFVAGNFVASTFSQDFKKQEENSFKTDYTHSVKAKITTLDCLIAEHGMPDYCKIDVEGFEPKALAGLSRKIGCLSFETHQDGMEAARLCLEKLQALGYSRFACDSHQGEEFTLDDWGTSEKALEKAKSLQFGNIFAK